MWRLREGRYVMKKLIVKLSLLVLLGTGVPILHSALTLGATSFTNTTIEAIDPGVNVTIRSPDGSTWTLPVSNAELTEGLSKSDRVSLDDGQFSEFSAGSA